MELTLSENIRSMRKARALTQEKLAEALGVTTGAVYKWESGLSVPELEMLVKLADFFDVSVDALLGYKMKDNRIDTAIEQLWLSCRHMDENALQEADKVLQKYPNSFRIVHGCAKVYLWFGTSRRDSALLHRALTLFEQARLLLSQNTDPWIGELTILSEMADAYILSGEGEKGIELLKKHNIGGIFSAGIGSTLAVFLNRPEEAEPFLSFALLRAASDLINTVIGYMQVFCARGNYLSAQQIVAWGLSLIEGLKKESETDFLDNIEAQLRIFHAHTLLKAGNEIDARASVQSAAALARRFDKKPDYSVGSVRFASIPGHVHVHDGFGQSAKDSIDAIIRMLDDAPLSKLWEDAYEHE